MNLSYEVDRSCDCIQIDTDNWLNSYSSNLSIYRMSGRTVTTYLTSVTNQHLSNSYSEIKENLQTGSHVLLSRIISEISRDRPYIIDGKKYFDVPVTQVIGYFKDNKITLENLSLLYNKVLIKQVFISNGAVEYVRDNTLVGKVIKVGINKTNTLISEGDLVLVQDNVSTQIELDGEKYFALDIENIVGLFDDLNAADIKTMKVINKGVILTEYESMNLFDSSCLLAPNLNYEELDFSDIYNRDIFQVINVDESLKEISKNDIIFTDRNLTFYVYFKGKKYFLINGIQNIYGRLNERKG